ncbi:hypothetical protein [Staphylococcus hyicus]|uniref:hypothetical protein n=1 Tax=Staphylococcus hyicus TaxID=1284 RepID=UPI003132F7E0
MEEYIKWLCTFANIPYTSKKQNSIDIWYLNSKRTYSKKRFKVKRSQMSIFEFI